MVKDEEYGVTYDDLKELGSKWLERIRDSEEREKEWRKNAAAAEAIYSANDDKESGANTPIPAFNILHSNIATIAPALYNSQPTPDIRPRHNEPGADNQGQPTPTKEAAEALEAVIATMIDDSALDEEMEALAQDAFTSGRGVIRVRFDADEVEAGPGLVAVADERLAFEVVNWDDYREGPATRWGEVPWIALRHAVSPEALKEMEEGNEEFAAILAAGRGPLGDNKSTLQKGSATVWEIWDRASREVLFLSEGGGEIFDRQPDPLRLKGFFPITRPVQPITIPGRRAPTCPYAVYRGLAEDLEQVNNSISDLVKDLRPRAIALAEASGIEAVESAAAGTVTVVLNAEQLVAMGGLERALTWWPLEPTVLALRELVQHRELLKQQIYEITGISDILRGQGAASETATAQSIKSQWGTLRVESLQKMIDRCVREVFVIGAQIIANHFSDEAIIRAAGLAQITPEALQLMRSPLASYRIDIESDSTRRSDVVKDQQQAQQFLEGTAAYFQTMTPVAQANPQVVPPLVELYGAFARRFNLGRQAEAALEQLITLAKQPPQPQGPTPEQMKAQADAEAKQADLQLKGQKLQSDHMLKSRDLDRKDYEADLKAAELAGNLAMEETRENFGELTPYD